MLILITLKSDNSFNLKFKRRFNAAHDVDFDRSAVVSTAMQPNNILVSE